MTKKPFIIGVVMLITAASLAFEWQWLGLDYLTCRTRDGAFYWDVARFTDEGDYFRRQCINEPQRIYFKHQLPF